MPLISLNTRAIIEECIEHAIRVRLDYTDCVRRAVHILCSVEPEASRTDAWQVTEALMAETLGRRASEQFAALATRH